MKFIRRFLIFGFCAYVAFCIAAAIFMVEANLHPGRRRLPAHVNEIAQSLALDYNAELHDISVTGQDGIVLRAWMLRPGRNNGNAVILLHGQGDNRLGMIGYAQLLLHHGFSVVMPDARAHGISGGTLATYGLLERDDIRRWFEWIADNQHPRCIFGLGESMGAAQLLEALETEPNFCAIAAESPFADFHEIAYDRAGQILHLGPWLGRSLLRPAIEGAFLYVRWKYGYDMGQVSPEAAAAQSKVPILLIHGQADSNIPLRHSRLIRIADPNVVLWEVPRADHCGAISTAPQQFEQHLIRWFDLHSSKPDLLVSN